MPLQQKLELLRQYSQGAPVVYRAEFEISEAPDEMTRELIHQTYLDVINWPGVQRLLSERFRYLSQTQLNKYRRDVN